MPNPGNLKDVDEHIIWMIFSQNVVKVNLSFVVFSDGAADQLEMMCFCLGFHY